jgi:4-alpha-glucanotransferase
MGEALFALAGRLGILPFYIDQMKRRRETSTDTARALLAAMGVDVADEDAARARLDALDREAAERRVAPYYVVTARRRPKLAFPSDTAWELTFEDGRTLQGRGPAALPVLPLGLHRLALGRETTTLLAAPRKLLLPEKCWGLIVPLAGLRDADTGGIGDYDDLARVGVGISDLGASYLGINPVHAGFPADPGAFSPYTPSHRRRLSTIYIPSDVSPETNAPLIDYARDIPLRISALRRQFASDGGSDAFEEYLVREGASLRTFATHQALSERHGAYWNHWPAELQDPASPAVRAAQEGLADDIRFHSWLQWRAEEALRAAKAAAHAAGMEHGLYLDLAVGTHPYGAETWEDRDSFAYGASLGAPPDAFTEDGQNWGLAPFDPHSLIARGFRPLAETLRRQLSLSGMIRIDHILGFDRAFWVPDAPGIPGAYVQMPVEAMLAVVRIEAARARAVVVGEDLGNIPDGLQRRLSASGILGCRVVIFEKDDGPPVRFRTPRRYTKGAIASFSTHDLPTFAGWRIGAEIEARAGLGHIAPDFALSERQKRDAEVAAFDTLAAGMMGEQTRTDPLDAMHGALAQAGSAVVAVQIENALGIVAQPNLPGTVDTYPNWRQRLPIPADAIATDARMRRVARIMKDLGR